MEKNENYVKWIQTAFNSMSYELERPLPSKYSYLKDNNDENKKINDPRKCLLKNKFYD